MSAFHLTYLIAILFMAHAIRRAYEGRGYACPSCGTTNQREHSNDCAWKRHYE